MRRKSCFFLIESLFNSIFYLIGVSLYFIKRVPDNIKQAPFNQYL